MYNFWGRCFKQLSANNVDNMCKLAELLRVKDRSTRGKAFKAIRASQIAGTQYWGSPSSGLQQILKEPRPGLDSLQKFAPKVTILIKAVMKDGVDEALNTKHFVYSAYTSTITHLGQTLESVRSDQGNPIFKQLKADDFEWQDGAAQTQLTLKPKPMSDVRRNPDAIVLISLKGSKDEKRKLMAAFGFVTPDGDRFEGLYRAGSRSVPLVQVMLGARETNQGLTFLRLQHIHIMEPNPPRIHAITHVFCKTKKVVAWRLQSIEKCRTRMSKGAISDCSTAPNTATEGFVQAACSLSIFVLLYQ
jgi:hypothetical protein